MSHASNKSLPILVNGRIIRVDKESCLVQVEWPPDMAPNKPAEALMVDTDAVRWGGRVAPAVGDNVLLELPEDGSVLGPSLHEILPRQTALYRKDPSQIGQEQVIASNMDIVGIVHGLDQKLSIARLERGLVIAAESAAESQLILTKADLVSQDYVLECLTAVQTLDTKNPVIVTSFITNQGIEELQELLQGQKTLVLLGSSGAGKSSLVNALLSRITQKTAEVRGTDARGRHATVVRSLIALPGGGSIIDTPGLRSIGLGEIDVGLDEVFSEIAELAEKCKFRDCAHLKEPGCAVKAAVKSGDLDEERLKRYLGLRAEADETLKEKEERGRKN